MVPNNSSALTIDACFSPKNYPKNAKLYGWITKTDYAEVIDGLLYTVSATTLSKTPLIKVDSFIQLTKTAIKATSGETVDMFGFPMIHWIADYQGWFEVGRFAMAVDFKKPVTDNLMFGPVQIKYSIHGQSEEAQATEFSPDAELIAVIKKTTYISAAEKHQPLKTWLPLYLAKSKSPRMVGTASFTVKVCIAMNLVSAKVFLERRQRQIGFLPHG